MRGADKIHLHGGLFFISSFYEKAFSLLKTKSHLEPSNNVGTAIAVWHSCLTSTAFSK